MRVYEHHGSCAPKVQLLRLMAGAACAPDMVGVNAAISACEKGRQWQVALALLSAMPSMRLIPDTVSFNAAISACEKVGRWPVALGLLVAMTEARAWPDEISFSSAISTPAASPSTSFFELVQ